MQSHKSIVLVTIDCLRADHVGFLGYSRPTTPFVDLLAQESFVFSRAIVAGAPTYYSLPAIFGSRYPLAFGRDVLGLAPDEPTLTSALRQAGYSTAAFCAANPYISARFGYSQGFETFHDFLNQERTSVPGSKETAAASPAAWTGRLNRALERASSSLGVRPIYDELYFRYCQRVTPAPDCIDALRRFPAADVIVDHAIEWLDSIGDQPFFLWLHLMDPHAPYYPKQEAVALLGDAPITPLQTRYLNSFWNRSDLNARRLSGRLDEILALYDAGIRWVDCQVERLVRRLTERKRWGNCVLALTADHGEEFLDHGARFHAPSRLMEEIICVPLLLRVPGLSKQQLQTTPFSTIHLAPTLLDIAQVTTPQSFQGRSWRPQLMAGERLHEVAVSESVYGCSNPFRRQDRLGQRVLSVRETTFKLLLNFSSGEVDLYDLETDPAEHAPLPHDAQNAVRRRLLQVAQEHLARPVNQSLRLPLQLRDLRLEWTAPMPGTPVVAG